MTTRSCLVYLLPLALCATIGTPGFAQADNATLTPEEARERVHRFEMPLIQVYLNDADAPNERQLTQHRKVIRKFFADLDSVTMKLAAIDMLDSRYVYAVDPELRVELVGTLLRDDDPRVRARAAHAAGYNDCGGKYAEELLGMLVGEPSVETLTSVAYAISRSDHEAFLPQLLKFTDHDNSEVRIAVASAVTRLAPEKAFAVNQQMLDDPETLVRKVAVQHFAYLPGDKSVQLVERMLDDPEAEVRERAIWTLESLQSRESADAIAGMLNDSSHSVRGRAAEVLGKLGSTEHSEAVAALLADDDVVARRYAAIGLGHMAEKKHLDALLAKLNDTDEQVIEYVRESIKAIESAANDWPLE